MDKTSRGREQFRKYKKILRLLTLFYKALPLRMRKTLFDNHRNMQGELGLGNNATIQSIDNDGIYVGVSTKCINER